MVFWWLYGGVDVLVFWWRTEKERVMKEKEVKNCPLYTAAVIVMSSIITVESGNKSKEQIEAMKEVLKCEGTSCQWYETICNKGR